MILTGNSLFSFRLLESENLQPPEILQPLLQYESFIKSSWSGSISLSFPLFIHKRQ